jgi:hypothetical protein
MQLARISASKLQMQTIAVAAALDHLRAVDHQ